MKLSKDLPRKIVARIVKTGLNRKLVGYTDGCSWREYGGATDFAPVAVIVRPDVGGSHLETQCVAIELGDRPRRIAVDIGVLNIVRHAANRDGGRPLIGQWREIANASHNCFNESGGRSTGRSGDRRCRSKTVGTICQL